VPIPPYRKFIEPILRYLALHPEGARIRDVYEAVATALGLSDQDRLETYPTGNDGKTRLAAKKFSDSMAPLLASALRKACS
jgi:restriction endonuclease Mrr